MKYRLWFVLGGILAVIALIIAVNLLFFGGTSVANFVDNEFDRDTSQDFDDDVRSYTSGEKPSAVSTLIVTDWKPLAQSADNSGVYLRYSSDAVVITPRGTGSTIQVMDADRAYRRYGGHTSGSWGWTSTHGGDFRGRGPGAGK